MERKGHVVLPARLESTRLPQKLIQKLGSKEILRHTWERVVRAVGAENVTIATNHEWIMELADHWGARCLLTSNAPQNGTERIIEVLNQLGEIDFVINVQGDEPFVDPNVVRQMWNKMAETKLETLSVCCPIVPEEIHADSVIKVVKDLHGFALYFSRSAIPFCRSGGTQVPIWRHLGLYAYTTALLHELSTWPPTPLEQCEMLEQLRILENGRKIALMECSRPQGPSIDVLADLELAQQIWRVESLD